ncbi:NAD(P)H-dependent oxidoreductase, partial [Staphylococcus aureus]|nr:NAD(P)H-dependent oxidoreductase [Staphylococcus aureus]
ILLFFLAFFILVLCGLIQYLFVINLNMIVFLDKSLSAVFLILGRPIFDGSFSGILKIALDLLNLDYFYMKPVGLIGNSGG